MQLKYSGRCELTNTMKQQSNTIVGVNNGFLNSRGRVLIFFSILIALGVTVFGESLYALGAAVLHRHGSSHGLFVPFISGYLFWLKLDKIRRMTPQVALTPGSAMMTAGAVIFIFSRNSTGMAFPVLSFLLIAAGLILMLFGKKVFKEVGFPLFFLAAMIPLPEAVNSQISEWMRQATTWGSVSLVKLFGIPLHRDGFDIYLPNIHLYVDHACSGVRYLLSYIVFGVAYAFRFKQSFKGRALVVMGAVPLSIAGGVLRLGVIFSSAYYIGPIMVEHRPHVVLSWTVFTVLLVGVIAVDRYISGVRDRVSGEGPGLKGKCLIRHNASADKSDLKLREKELENRKQKKR
jgi:exosortase